jgi:hypothetical protein
MDGPAFPAASARSRWLRCDPPFIVSRTSDRPSAEDIGSATLVARRFIIDIYAQISARPHPVSV